MSPSTWNLRLNWSTSLENDDFDENLLITSEPWDLAKKFNYSEQEVDHVFSNVRTLPLTPPKGGLKSDFYRFCE